MRVGCAFRAEAALELADTDERHYKTPFEVNEAYECLRRKTSATPLSGDPLVFGALYLVDSAHDAPKVVQRFHDVVAD